MSPDSPVRCDVPYVCFMGIPVCSVNAEQLIDIIISWGKGDGLRTVYNVNAHAINLAFEHEDFKRYLRNADLVFCDGFGVKLGANILGLDIPCRLTPPDWIDRFASSAADAGQSVFALGDEDGVADSFQQQLSSKHEGYLCAGSFHGFFDKSGAENDALIERINDSGAVHLLVGFGMPLQERWIEENRHRLKVKVAIPVGALFRWYTGHEKRGHSIFTNNGLEWLTRLANHPIKHFRRYVIGNTVFLARVLMARISRSHSSS